MIGSDWRSKFRAISPLAKANADKAAKSCKICGGLAPFFDVVDFNKCHFYEFGPSGIHISYYRCIACDFLFSPDFDAWTIADFGEFIYNDDLWMVDVGYQDARPRLMAEAFSSRLEAYKGLRVLDYGAGSGKFAVLMQASGYDITPFDPVSLPTRPTGAFDLVTCFEVIEHSPNPKSALEDIVSFLKPTGAVIFSQTLQPPDIESIRCNWWYAAPRNGHISFYTERTLQLLGALHGFHLHSHDSDHIFCRDGSQLEAYALRISPRVANVQQLGAPLVPLSDHFHGIEGSQSNAFRWSRSRRLSWPVTIVDGSCKIRIPFVHQIRAGFAAESRIVIGGKPAATQVVSSALVAEAHNVSPGHCVVELQTPTLLRPIDVNGQDDHRELGLAIKIV